MIPQLKHITTNSFVKLFFRHIGKLAGASIGAISGLGIFGAVLGTLVGALIDEIVYDRKILKRGARMFSYPEEVALDAHWARAVASIGLSAAVLTEGRRQAGNEVEINLVEIELLKNRIVTHLNLSGRDSHIAQMLTDRFFTNRTADIKGLAALHSRFESPEEQEKLMSLLFASAQNDEGYISPGQSDLIKLISVYLNISADRFNQIREEHIRIDDQAYTLLGVSRHATTTEIKRVYRKLAAQFHPDHGSEFNESQKKQTQEAFLRIKNAYLQILDERKSRRDTT